jgi:Family of unknown function (DUF6282)
MCDGVGAAAAGVPVHTHLGRWLTVDRARELNSRTWFYEMLKDNPRLTAIHPGIEDEILVGAVDHHIHAFPDFVHRSQNMVEVAVEASKARMRAIAFKDHWNLTAGEAYLVQRQIDDMVLDGRLEHRVEVFGGLGLNLGINPEAVRVGLKYPNFKCIWFPTFKSYGWARFAGIEDRDDPSQGYVRLVDANGNVLPEVHEVLQIAADADVCIGFGHTDFEELLPLATLAKEIGVRTVLDHPLLELNKLTLDEMVTLAQAGTYVGTYCQPMIPSIYQPIADPFETVQVVGKVGADRCVAATDFGQVLNLNAIDGLRVFVRALLGFGVEPPDVKTIVRDTPADLLGLKSA